MEKKSQETKRFKKVVAEIVKVEGEKGAVCAFGHKVGEKFTFDQYGCERKICVYALAALMPAVNVLLHNGKFPWMPDGETLYFGCPHPGKMYPGLGQLIFKLTSE